MSGHHAIESGGRVKLLPSLVAVAAVCLLSGGPVHAGSGCPCIRAQADAPMLLPDGNLYPAGTLTICDSMKLSPVTSLHKTFVNGQPVAILASRRRSSEISSDAPPVVVFQRDLAGNLELVGYVLPSPTSTRRGTTFVLAAGREIGERTYMAAGSTGSAAGSLVVLAASAR